MTKREPVIGLRVFSPTPFRISNHKWRVLIPRMEGRMVHRCVEVKHHAASSHIEVSRTGARVKGQEQNRAHGIRPPRRFLYRSIVLNVFSVS